MNGFIGHTMRMSLATTVFWIALSDQTVWASNYYSWLVVRYSENNGVKTFLQGPYNSKSGCDKLNQITWDNVLTARGSCKVEMKHCDRLEGLPDLYKKLLRRERAVMPYVIATPKGRIFFSGISTNIAIEECHRMAKIFQTNGYSEARCVLP
jgi:hypothetical protein